MEIALDRRGLLVDQLDSSAEFARARLTGLTDDEYFWEPVAGMWSVRPRGSGASGRPLGPGSWLLDAERSDPDPSPLTTIAWRLGHLTNCLAGRWEYTFGPRATDPADVVDFPATAAAALDLLWSRTDRWRTGVAGLTEEQMDTVGFGTYPWGLDPDLPIIGIVWWINREFIHHLAEVALLRDLYRAQH